MQGNGWTDGAAAWPARAGALLLVLCVLAAAAAAGAASAGAATLSGTVGYLRWADRNPLSGADVTVSDAASGRPVASTTSGLGGAYSVTVPDGVYDVTFSEFGFRSHTVARRAVRGDGTLDALVVQDGHVRFDLDVRSHDGRPSSGGASLDGSYVALDASGSAVFGVPAGSHPLSVSGYGSGQPYWWLSDDSVDLAADRSVTVVLPQTTELTVRVRGWDGLPLEQAHVGGVWFEHDLAATGSGLSGQFQSYTDRGPTDAAGEVRYAVFDGSVPERGDTVHVFPPPGSGNADAFVPVPSIRGPTELEVRLERESFRVSGVLSGPDGPIAGANLSLAGIRPRTAADGSFAFDVAPGDYTFYGFGDGWSFNAPLSVRGDRTLEVRLPARAELTVRVLGAGGRPAEGAGVQLPPAWVDGDLGDLANAQLWEESGWWRTPTDAAGEARFRLFLGVGTPRDGFVEPPRGSSYDWTSFPMPAIDRAKTIEVQLRSADATAPTIACDPAPTGWHAANVSVGCEASDAESGLADPRADAAFELTTTVPEGVEDARAQTGTRQVCDLAGNCVTAGPVGPVAVDRAAPSIALTIAPEPLVRGDWWTVSRVAVQVLADDANVATIACSVDGIARTFAVTRGATTLAGTFYANQEGRHTVGCTATDRLGHIGSGQRPVNIDLRAPLAPTASADRPADDPVNGWYGGAVTVSFADNGDPALADGSAGSGVDPASVPASQRFASSGTFTVSGSVTDVAGRVSAVRRLTVKVDADPPTTTLSCPAQVTFGASASARFQAADGHSGLVGPASGTVAIDTSRAGPVTVSHHVQDRVGNRAGADCQTTVVHPFVLRGGLQAPPALNAIAPGVTTVPVRFSIGGDRGLGILAGGTPRIEQIACVGGESIGRPALATTTAPLAYDAVTGRYTIAWDAGADLAAGTCAALTIELDDGVTREVRFAR